MKVFFLTSPQRLPSHFLRPPYRSLITGIVLLLCSGWHLCSVPALVARPIDDPQGFQLPGTRGELLRVHVEPEVKGWVLCFVGTECPMARQYGPLLSRLAVDWRDQGVRVIGINSNAQDSLEDLQAYERELGITFPLAKDYDNLIADRYRAERTPEVILLDSELREVYRGAIDDQFQPGVARPEATQFYLRTAVSQLLAGQPISPDRTQGMGCRIGRVKQAAENPTVTYARDVAPVLQRHCVECHRTGEIGPFALTDYDSAKGWAEMMVEVVDEGRMPPWHADPHFGSFVNERLMPEQDKQILRNWLSEGAPFGSPNDLPPPAQFTEGWRLPRQPDQIITMREKPYCVPAEGTVEYQYFVVDPGFKEDKWVTAVEVVPGNRRVVHHSIVFVRPPDGTRARGIGWLGAYVPGQSAPDYDPQRGRLIPAGSKLVFQQHYTPVGSAEDDLTSVGLVFGEESEIREELVTLIGLNQEFEIPPAEPQYVVESSMMGKPSRGRLLAVAPHMHYRGKAFELFRETDGQRETLLRVPEYDFNWQHSYRFREPLSLDEIEELPFRVTFDNSPDNPFNPDPEQRVMWGDQTWEEMAVAFFEVAFDRNRDAEGVATNAVSQKPQGNDDAAEQTLRQRIEDETDAMFKELDQNQDGVILPGETPVAFRHFGFSRYDLNGDGELTREEVRTNFERALRSRNP